MSCQSHPETYAIVIRCNLKDGALLRTMAKDAGQTISTFIGAKVHEMVGERDLTDEEQKWYNEHLAVNEYRRKKADALNAKGYYKHKRRGRPRKPGPRKGSKRMVGKMNPPETI